MKTILLVVAALMLALCLNAQTLMHYWNFNTGAPGTDQNWTLPIMAATGSGQLTHTFTEAYSFTGTTINGVAGESNGGSFAPRGGIDMVNNGAHFTLSVPSTGFENIVLTYPTRRTSSGFHTQEIQYSTDGTTWQPKETVDISGYENNWVSTQLVTVDFTGIAGVDNNPNFKIRIILTGATSAVGNNRFDNIQVVASNQGATAPVQFSPLPGVYSSPMHVTLASATSGAVIYYTTNGTDPTLSSPQYASPIPVSSTTTIKAMAKAPSLDASQITSGAYIFPVSVSNVAQLRAQTPGDGTVYQVTGPVIMTFKQTFRNQKYVQDNAAGVLIDDTAGVITTNYNVGDAIVGLTGTIARYNNMLQLTPVANPGPPASTGNGVFVPVVTIQQVNGNIEMYQSRLVRINNAHFVGASGAFANGTNYNLEDASGTIVFRSTFYDVDYIGTDIPTNNFSLVSIVNQFNQTPQLTARNLADWGAVDNDDYVANPNQTELLGNYPNPFNPKTTIEFNAAKSEPAQITIYNLKGQAVKHFTIDSPAKGINKVTWDGKNDNGIDVASGTYLFRLRSGSYSSTKKMIMMK